MAFENVDYKSLDIPAAPFSDPSIIPDFPKNKVPRHVEFRDALPKTPIGKILRRELR